ncbi:DUF1822 family protein [Phormidium pseudopriestleyi FRX01]|uniref:DUF1822 family protein n=1 Tax=Phormidium pseudopriestleyi FRX01 TaxID=1759528 RepID=A0ABS3FQA5_9CYAN|nr:DUF1822 family protein [Phormidium pseudopriestleyi]MBO0349304.1 DUF1822 family protein [Phormidium pseudopriestleyi FRX01]
MNFINNECNQPPIKTYPERMRFKIAPDHQEEAWQMADRHSNTITRYQAYLNWLTLKTLLPWFEEWAREEGLPAPCIWPKAEQMVQSLELVNGTAIELDLTRFILIPMDEIESESVEVPQEWVDHPNWLGDYYLPIIVSLDGDEDNCWIEVVGFATHQQIKTEGNYDANTRIYGLEMTDFIPELTVMEITRGLQVRAPIPPLPVLSEVEAKKWVQILGNPSIYSPRLQGEIPFETWAALLDNQEWQQQLGDRRMGKVPEVASNQPLQELRQWLHQVTEEGLEAISGEWQDFEALFVPPIAVRGKSETIQAIAPVIRLLQPDELEQTRRHAAGVLGQLAFGNSEAIDALTQLLHTARDEETLWQAALSLGKISPGHPQAGIKKARYLDWGMYLQGHSMALIVAIMPKNDDKLGIYLQVQPTSPGQLPPHLKLSVLSASEETIREAESRSDRSGEGQDNLIQLRFSPPPGTHFRVRVSLKESSITEDFIA